MEVFFCDGCGTRLTEQDLEARRAVRFENEAFCKSCLSTRPELAKLAARARKTRARPTEQWTADAAATDEPEAEPDETAFSPVKSHASTIIIAVGVVVAVGAIVAVLALGQKPHLEEERPRPVERVRPPAPPKPKSRPTAKPRPKPIRRPRSRPKRKPSPRVVRPPKPRPAAADGKFRLVYVQGFATTPFGWSFLHSPLEGHGGRPGSAVAKPGEGGSEIVFSPPESGRELVVGTNSYLGFAYKASGARKLVVSVTTPEGTFKESLDLKQGEWTEREVELSSMTSGPARPKPGETVLRVHFLAPGGGSLSIDSFFYAVNATPKDMASVRARFAGQPRPAPAPAPSPAPGAAPERAPGAVIARYDFDDGLTHGWEGRAVEEAGRKCLLAGSHLDNEWFSSTTYRRLEFLLGKDTRLTMTYLLDRGETIKLQCQIDGMERNVSEEVAAVTGAWETVVFNVTGLKGAAPGYKVTGINLMAGTPRARSKFLIDEIIIHEGELPPAARKLAGPAVAPPGPPGKVLFAEDFEKGYVKRWRGSAVELPGGRSKWAFQAAAREDRWFSNQVKMGEGDKKLKGESLSLFFRCKLLDPAPEMKFQISNTTLRKPCYKFLEPPVVGVWQAVCIPFSELKVEGGGNYVPGHVMSPGYLFAGEPGKPVRFYVDDLVFFDGGAPESVARDLTPRWAPRAATLYFSDFEAELNGLRFVESCPGAVGNGVRTLGKDGIHQVVYRPRYRKPKESFIAPTSRDIVVAFYARAERAVELVIQLEVTAEAGEAIVRFDAKLAPGGWRTVVLSADRVQTSHFPAGEEWWKGLPIHGIKFLKRDVPFELDALWLCSGVKANDVRSAYEKRLMEAVGSRRRPAGEPPPEQRPPAPDGPAEKPPHPRETAKVLASFDFEEGAAGWSGGERRGPGFRGKKAYGNKLDEDGLAFSAELEPLGVDAQTWLVFACKSTKPRNVRVAAETEAGAVRKLLAVPEGRRWLKLAFRLAEGYGEGKAALEEGTKLLKLKFDSQAALRAGLCSIDEVKLVRASSRESALAALGE